jgi:hypothetical protein
MSSIWTGRPKLRLEQKNSSSRKDDVERKKNKRRKKDGKEQTKKGQLSCRRSLPEFKMFVSIEHQIIQNKEYTFYRNLH